MWTLSKRRIRCFYTMAQHSPVGQSLLIVRIHDHTQVDTPHSVGISVRVISPTQRPLPDNTQQSQEIDLHALGGIQTHNPKKRAAAEPRFRPSANGIGRLRCFDTIVDLHICVCSCWFFPHKKSSVLGQESFKTTIILYI
jgi:hypothetical protein